jgi:Domain of unknown function (DUF4352)
MSEQQPPEPYQGQPQQPYYPQQPMMPPPKKKHTGRNIFIGCGGAFAILVVIIIIVVIAANANASKANTGTVVNNGSTATTQATTAPATQSDFKIGQVVSVASTWQITVLSAKTSTGSQFNTPQKPGDLFLVITISVKNISGQSQNMSSALQWNLQDSTGQKYNITIDTDAGATLDGAVAAGRPLKGVISYEIPKTLHSFTLSFQNDITSTDQSIWDITV